MAGQTSKNCIYSGTHLKPCDKIWTTMDLAESHSYGEWLANAPEGEEVCITGMSGQFPDSRNLQVFGEKISNKVELISDDERRWKVDHKEIPQRGGKICDIERMDGGFFGLHYRQVNTMDPMIRVFLESAIECIMDAGVNPAELEGTNTGVFVGAAWSDDENRRLTTMTEEHCFAVTGYLKTFLANRLSYFLKLKGLSFVADTACSSSFSALQTAFDSIRAGKCDRAIVGTSGLILHPGTTLQFSRLGVLSPDARCKVFDEDANGYVRGESVSCIFLQKTKESKRIYAQIVHGKVNSDGNKIFGITYPSVKMQSRLISQVYSEAKIDPSELAYIEAHGTGTKVGDPQEIKAIDLALSQKRDRPLLVGSVKSNLGHTEASSGFNSLVKVLLAMESGFIAPNINLKKLRNIEAFNESRMQVVTELTPLEGDIVSINNFGFGGSNVHLILKRIAKKSLNRGLPEDNLPRLVCVSGRTQKAVEKILNQINSTPMNAEFIGLLHSLFSKKFPTHYHRGYTVVTKVGPMVTAVESCKTLSKICLTFGDLDDRFQLIGRNLLKFPVFKSTLLRVQEILTYYKIDIISAIKTNKIEDSTTARVGSVTVQIGIIELLKDLSICPDSIYDKSPEKLVGCYYNETIDLKGVFDALLKNKNLNGKIPTNIKSLSNRAARYFNKNLDHSGILEINDHDSCYKKFHKNTFMLDLSNGNLNQSDDITVAFLDIIGRLFLKGQNPQLQKLYPPVQFPVSRNTPMIAPLIRWHHPKWDTFRFQGFDQRKTSEKYFILSDISEEYFYLKGHIIDGRRLLPATLYLYLAWYAFATVRNLLPIDLPVVFKNCKFMRAVTFKTDGYTHLNVSIMRGSGRFEVLQDNTCAVSGTIALDKVSSALPEADFPIISLEENEPTLTHQEIYTELNLRGYNYTGNFKGLVKCNVEATKGIVRWENNWVSFMDNMLQMKIMQLDSRQLFVPTFIKKLVINPSNHLEMMEKLGENPEVPVRIWKELNLIKSGAIEIEGLQATSISRKKDLNKPVLERYLFVPNQIVLDKIESLRVMVQIILENSLEKFVKGVELVKDSPRTDYISPLLSQVMSDLPLIDPELIIAAGSIAGENDFDETIKVQPFTLKPDSDLSIIIGTNLLQRNIKPYFASLKDNGYLISREDVNFSYNPINEINIVAIHKLETETLVLFTKSIQFEPEYVGITDDLSWLQKVKALSPKTKVVLHARNIQDNGILGLVNCLRREPLGNRFICIFIMDQNAAQFDPDNPLYREQIRKNQAFNIYKKSSWGTYRHLVLNENQEIDCVRSYISCRNKGDLSSLVWKEGNPFHGESNIVHIYYSAINFKDIMVASGRISTDYLCKTRFEHEEVLGFEFSGRDSRGRRVMGISRCGAGSNMISNPKLIFDIPDKWSLEDAATVPIVYITLLYAMLMRVKLQQGSSILIHSAAGGVGLAALNIAFHYKCEIFVTVGNEEKRKILKELYPYFRYNENRIGNSHDTSFEEMIKQETDGQGVDVVLNSLAEDKLRASIRCLKYGGSLLEIGKYDLTQNNNLELLYLEKAASYHGIIADDLMFAGKDLQQKLGDQMKKGIREGFIKPLPRSCFNYTQLEEAYRFMTTGKHVGKVLLKIRDEEVGSVTSKPLIMKGVPRFFALGNRSYVIIGGLGGFGLELADWLVLRGAKKLVLSSRTGTLSAYQIQRIDLWQSYGIKVHVLNFDVTTRSGCEQLITTSEKIAPVDAIFNLAAVLADKLFEDQDEETFATSLKPKAVITRHLDNASRTLCPNLRHFIVFSSVSCGRGNAGQTNYGFSNSIMERICERRKEDGLPALAIQWGAIGQVGLVAKMQPGVELEIGGTLQQKVESCLEALDVFINQTHPVVASMVVAEKKNKNIGTGTAVDAVAMILGIKNFKTVSHNASLAELGMDSMRGSEILQILEKDFEIYLTPKQLRALTFSQLIEIEADKSECAQQRPSDVTVLDFVPTILLKNLSIVPLASKAIDKSVKLFVFPGVNGDVNSLEHITENLEVEAWGLLYRYKDSESSITEMAFNLLPHILEKLHLPNDNQIILCGYSFGAMVVIEVQRLLEERNLKCRIIFIDGAPWQTKAIATSRVPIQEEAEIENSFILQILSAFFTTREIEQHKVALLECKNSKERIEFINELLDEDTRRMYNLHEDAGTCLMNRLQAIFKYQIPEKKFNSRAHLMKASSAVLPLDNADYSLSQIYEDVIVKEIAGNHKSILQSHDLIECIKSIIVETKSHV